MNRYANAGIFKNFLTTKQMYSISNLKNGGIVALDYQDIRLSGSGYQEIRRSGFFLAFWYPEALHSDFLVS